jgi:hypothetical protein
MMDLLHTQGLAQAPALAPVALSWRLFPAPLTLTGTNQALFLPSVRCAGGGHLALVWASTGCGSVALMLTVRKCVVEY